MEVVVEDDKIRGLRCQKVLSVFDEQGRFSPEFDEQDRRVIEGDTVIFSIGQASEPPFLGAIEGVQHERGILKVDPQTKQTAMEGVFGGGDVASGPGLFINCIQDGSLAALAIDAYMQGTTLQRKRREVEHCPLPRPDSADRNRLRALLDRGVGALDRFRRAAGGTCQSDAVDQPGEGAMVLPGAPGTGRLQRVCRRLDDLPHQPAPIEDRRPKTSRGDHPSVSTKGSGLIDYSCGGHH
ncbi:MAG: FAD-dependent oxidoreductase [Candidatus Nealsonbacteria bacterium]|nr:FAD-dependent oxidoreductase [Candidatus Nealsonbacteria bacterium]